jgi:hypothetical protein
MGMPMVLPEGAPRLAVHCAAFMFGTFADLIQKGSAKYIQGQGTMTFVRQDNHFFGITNEHCLGRLTEREQLVYHVALAKHMPVPKPPIFKSTPSTPDFPYDIAVFRLDGQFLHDSDKQFVSVTDDSTALNEGDLCTVVGFPGHRRQEVGNMSMRHEAWSVVSHCQLSSDRTIRLQDTLTFDGSKINLGGFSGGPVFKNGNNGQYQLVGICYMQGNPTEAPSGRQSHEVILLGFPLNRSMLRRMVDLI